MARALTIGETSAADRDAILALYPLAFPAEDLTGIVGDLLGLSGAVLSLAAWQGDALAGHALFTSGAVATKDGPPVALLGPLAVAPDHQRQGIGRRLVEEGLARLKAQGVALVLVLGDPAYYGRLGFLPERDVLAPYPLPDEWATAWQSVRLDTVAGRPAGRLVLPRPWMRPELWLP